MAPAQRTAFLAELAADDAALAAEVRGLLAADAEAEDFLEGGAHPAWAGRRFGPWRVVGEVARGGMGIVLLGERADGRYDARVAIKVLNTAYRDGLAARFRTEGRILAELDHPNIARLLDAGTTDRGRPFFVMELVVGPPLATLCRQRELPLEQRIELFLQVLDATQHAHQKAVIHRDLSSSNVLTAEIDGRIQPKIIDFGIAKSLADPLLQGGAMTFQGTMMGTPEFMSPEQAEGRTNDIDTRADVYSL
ncbi:MAG: serine/threonine protein kinase, partial [Gemmatimonadetes bacterium]|nr:serine/threonine protein kinase [Gemmatimonadota bacterium]